MFSQIVSFISQALHILPDVGSPHLSHSFNTVLIFSTSSVLINEFNTFSDNLKSFDKRPDQLYFNIKSIR